MGAFNTVITNAICPRCHQYVKVIVQFKYGDTWQHEYIVSDVLIWGGNDFGVAGTSAVVVDGIAQTPCPKCNFEGEWGFYVFIKKDRIDRVVTATGEYDFSREGKTYIILHD